MGGNAAFLGGENVAPMRTSRQCPLVGTLMGLNVPLSLLKSAAHCRGSRGDILHVLNLIVRVGFFSVTRPDCF